MFPACRYPDPVTHDLVTPCGTTVFLPGVPDPQPTLIEGLPAAHVTHGAACTGVVAAGIVHPPPPLPVPIVKGAMTTWVGGFPLARWAPSLDVAGCGVFLGNLSLSATRTTLVGDAGGAPSATITFNANGTVTVVWGSITITGTPADVATFVGMLTHDLGATAAGRANLLAVVNDTGHPTTYLVGRNQPGVLVDAFNTNQVDLSDLEQFPTTPPAGHPNTATRGEVINHFLTERNDDANFGAGRGANRFGPAHQQGINAQNSIRNELGQSPATSNAPAGTDAAGNQLINLNYADGTATVLHLNNNSDIVQFDPP
jgi:hypothetical protein